MSNVLQKPPEGYQGVVSSIHGCFHYSQSHLGHPCWNVTLGHSQKPLEADDHMLAGSSDMASSCLVTLCRRQTWGWRRVQASNHTKQTQILGLLLEMHDPGSNFTEPLSLCFLTCETGIIAVHQRAPRRINEIMMRSFQHIAWHKRNCSVSGSYAYYYRQTHRRPELQCSMSRTFLDMASIWAELCFSQDSFSCKETKPCWSQLQSEGT